MSKRRSRSSLTGNLPRKTSAEAYGGVARGFQPSGEVKSAPQPPHFSLVAEIWRLQFGHHPGGPSVGTNACVAGVAAAAVLVVPLNPGWNDSASVGPSFRRSETTRVPDQRSGQPMPVAPRNEKGSKGTMRANVRPRRLAGEGRAPRSSTTRVPVMSLASVQPNVNSRAK